MNAHQESKNKEEKESFKDSKEKEKEQEEGSKENSSKQEGDKEESSEKRQKTEDKEGEKTKQEETRKGSGGGNNKEGLGSKQEEAKAESAQSEDKGRKIYDEPVGPSMMPKMESEEKIGEEREEKGFFGRETEKYFSRKKLGEIVFGSALILEVPKAAGGWILHMGGAGVKKLSDNFPEGSKVVDTLLEYVNKPVDFLIENMGKGYSWSKGNIIFLSGKVFGSEGGAKVAEGIGGMEREVGDVAAKFKPTEKQGYALKFLEVIGLTKIFASIAKFSANKLVKDAKIDGKADVHADTAGKGQVDDIKIDPYKEAMREGGKHQAWAKQYVDKPDIELERGIKSFEKQIKLHEDKIKNPEKYYPDFKKLDIREQEANINKIWPRDIRKQQEQKRILEDILKNRKKE
ncbi:hypothetical protein NF27_FR00010 [Candidatus Jidaibacter acanthamoeba]|uniref:Pre-toxin TG domain-containing protein n=1 Tax=Candidatus Jidaibacter acanthamoebae TaxID=86105 RepID=A0A0C1QXN5_9RICK|nr:hypothetical protein [Candidatus Jidaibacter acanthamoeba]KIE04805.1 hypothetical protein NF27_FR00010 [Candidatus Jidaibacter acanthamoeba]